MKASFQLNLRLTADEVAALRGVAERSRLPMSTVLRVLIGEAGEANRIIGFRPINVTGPLHAATREPGAPSSFPKAEPDAEFKAVWERNNPGRRFPA